VSTSILEGRTRGYGGARGVSRLSIPTLTVLDGFSFLIPFVRFLEIDVVGRLYLTEVLLAAFLPFLFLGYGRRLYRRLPLTAISLLILWMLAQVGTDLIQGTPFHDYSRGWAKIGFTLINFCAIYLLVAGNRKRLTLFAAGLAFGSIAEFLIAPDAYAIAYPWKFGYGSGVTLLIVLVAVALQKGRRFVRLAPAAILLFAAALNLYMGFRSTGGVAFLAGCYLVVLALRPSRTTPLRVRSRHIVLAGATAVLAAWGVLQLYEYSVRVGWLGQGAREKYELQAAGEYGLLLGGRSEILVSSRAIVDSPVVGHGSWAKDCRYALLFLQLKQRAGYLPGEESDQCLIPAHSYLMGTWVEAGIFGAIFWIWALRLPFRALARLYVTAERLTPLVAFLALLMIWDIFFSPYAGEERLTAPFYIVLMMNYLSTPWKAGQRRSTRLSAASALPEQMTKPAA